MSFSSVRLRLTLWHTVILGALLTAFALAAYVFVTHVVRVRTDASLTDALLDLQMALGAERSEHASTPALAREALSDMRFRTIALVVFDSTAHVVASAIPRPVSASNREEPETPFDPRRLSTAVANAARSNRPRTFTLPDAEGGYRVQLATIEMPDGRFVLAATTPLHQDAELLAAARVAMSVAIPVTLLLAWFGGWLLARRSLAPMIDIRDAAEAISARNLGERVPIANPDDEVGQLATVINGLLDRLERAFAQQRQFMADASHELRTPVAVVQNEAARVLARPARSAADYEDALAVVHAAARRLRRIVDDLFLLARADAGDVPLRREPLYLDEVVADCVREVRSLADARAIDIQRELPNEAPYDGDEALLHRLVINLLDNAIKYSRRGCHVSIRLERSGGAYRLRVQNTGEPIPAELQSRVFDRFVRGDSARTRLAIDDPEALTSGAGLGLPIASWIAHAHGGTLELARSDPSGTTFSLTLPLADSGHMRSRV